MASALLLTGVGCTPDESPEPEQEGAAPEASEDPAPTGLRVGVVAPPSNETDPTVLEELEEGLDELTGASDGEVTRLRLVEAEDEVFVEDVAALLADDGADLVCVLGRQAATTATALADRFPATRFCAAPAALPEPPGNVDGTLLATDQLGAAVAAAVVALTDDDARVGVVVRSTERGDPERFVTGLRDGLAGLDASLHLVVDEESARDTAGELLDDEVDVLVVDLPGGLAATLVDEVGDEVPVVASAAAAAGLGEDRALLTFRPRWSRVVAVAVERALDAETPVPAALGFGVEAFGFETADRLDDAVTQALADAVEALQAAEPTERAPGRLELDGEVIDR